MTPITSLQQAVWDRRIEELRQTSHGRRVVVVEGDDDKSFLEGALRRRRGGRWVSKVAVVVAEGRDRALRWVQEGGIAPFSGSFCWVDRDTWTVDEIEAERLQAPFLFVTPGWCAESRFLAVAAVGGLGDEIKDELERHRSLWVRAGAWWWVAHRWRLSVGPWWERLGTYGGIPMGLDLSGAGQSLERCLAAGAPPLPDFNAAALAARWEARLLEAETWSTREQWSHAVHGKIAFQSLVRPLLPAEEQSSLYGRLGEELEIADDDPLAVLLALLLA